MSLNFFSINITPIVLVTINFNYIYTKFIREREINRVNENKSNLT